MRDLNENEMAINYVHSQIQTVLVIFKIHLYTSMICLLLKLSMQST